MIIRNVIYKKLNEKEKKIIDRYFEYCKKDYEIRNKAKYYVNAEQFWNCQRDELTYNENGGLYECWVEE